MKFRIKQLGNRWFVQQKGLLFWFNVDVGIGNGFEYKDTAKEMLKYLENL